MPSGYRDLKNPGGIGEDSGRYSRGSGGLKGLISRHLNPRTLGDFLPVKWEKNLVNNDQMEKGE